MICDEETAYHDNHKLMLNSYIVANARYGAYIRRPTFASMMGQGPFLGPDAEMYNI